MRRGLHDEVLEPNLDGLQLSLRPPFWAWAQTAICESEVDPPTVNGSVQYLELFALDANKKHTFDVHADLVNL